MSPSPTGISLSKVLFQAMRRSWVRQGLSFCDSKEDRKSVYSILQQMKKQGIPFERSMIFFCSTDHFGKEV